MTLSFASAHRGRRVSQLKVITPQLSVAALFATGNHGIVLIVRTAGRNCYVGIGQGRIDQVWMLSNFAAVAPRMPIFSSSLSESQPKM
jgi:hypothetical protein